MKNEESGLQGAGALLPSFSAVILAGGKSSRMGRDKAFIELDGRSLIQRQVQLVREAGAREVFVSGKPGADYPVPDCAVLEDEHADAGPLAGIERALASATQPLLLVLAVDMPAMTAGFIRAMIAASRGGAGVVPRVDGLIEPLAAVYPRVAQPLAVGLLDKKQFAVTRFAEQCAAMRLLAFQDLPAAASVYFTNWNSPSDISPCPN